MSTRLQVILSDEDAASLREHAAREAMTVSEWVRRALREAGRRQSTGRIAARLAAVHAAAAHNFPAPDVEQMLAETEQGYVG